MKLSEKIMEAVVTSIAKLPVLHTISYTLPAGLPPAATELLRRASVPARRNARVERARVATLTAVQVLDAALGGGDEPESLPDQRVYAEVIRAAHAVGSGGYLGAGGPGCGTARPDVLAAAGGSGRRHAGDGGAWDAALTDGVRLAIEDLGERWGSSAVRLILHDEGAVAGVCESRLAVHAHDAEGSCDGSVGADPGDVVELVGPGHALSLARAAVLFAAGHEFQPAVAGNERGFGPLPEFLAALVAAGLPLAAWWLEATESLVAE